jgi:hypothetical protein
VRLAAGVGHGLGNDDSNCDSQVWTYKSIVGADYKTEKKLKLPRAWLKVERGHIETDNTVCDLTG